MTDLIEKNSILTPVSDTPFVAILLCTYNGAQFLAEQLDSLEAQTHQQWVAFASDDCSTDKTIKILRQYQAKWPSGKLTIRTGPQKGFCQNFLSLACDPNICADYYAFCDQDDVWLPEKISIALEHIETNQQIDIPYLYCGRTKYVTEKLKPCGMSPLFVFPPSFRNALVQSIAGGNTMVFNQAAKLLLEKVGQVDVPSHDWWIYQLISGVDGNVFYDRNPQLLYRQHEFALVGGNNSLPAKIERVWMLLQGRFQGWNTQNIEALKQVNHLLVKNHRDILSMFETLRGAGLKDRFRLMEVCGLYRQTRRGTFSLFLAAVVKKI
ncbi:glycosyltransferase family 2 protein [Polynucleobacter paneuropaeus]|nr:glycosyltransferase family 2 protein [Polynucleobacter paneuropaeus]